MVNDFFDGRGQPLSQPLSQPKEAPINNIITEPALLIAMKRSVSQAHEARNAQIADARAGALKPHRPRGRGERRRRRVEVDKIKRHVARGGIGSEFSPIGKRVDDAIRTFAVLDEA